MVSGAVKSTPCTAVPAVKVYLAGAAASASPLNENTKLAALPPGPVADSLMSASMAVTEKYTGSLSRMMMRARLKLSWPVMPNRPASCSTPVMLRMKVS